MAGGAQHNSTTLLLFPTDAERQAIVTSFPVDHPLIRAELCGFGPVAAAARTAFLIGRVAPRRVLLAGIAGTYDENHVPLGSAASFASVAIDGIGAGTGPEFVAASAMGFAQWDGDNGTASGAIEERIELHRVDFGLCDGDLLTCCAASDSVEDVAARRMRFPDAVAEDMEAFGVAMACAMAGVPVAVVRGISNRAGDRERSSWRMAEALEAAGKLVSEIMESHAEWKAPT